MKNYYKILEIDENASQEIIEKAYKVLVKKYHPDLQTTLEEKVKCEEKIKEINEAYDIISNENLRKEYDQKLQHELNTNAQKTRQEQEQEQVQVQTQQHYTSVQKNSQNIQNTQQTSQAEYQRQYQNAINKAYHDAYIQDLKRRGYRIRYKKTLNDYLRSATALLITIGIVLLVLQLPFVKDYINELYKDNVVIRAIIDSISDIFN